MKNLPIIAVILVLVAAVGGFAAGMKYQQNQSPSTLSGNYANMGQRFGRNGQNGFGQNGAMRPVSGEVLNLDDKSITVKLADGSSKIVLLTGTTAFTKSTTGSLADVKVGERVAAFGTANSDGSVTAQNVQINPIQRNPTQ